MYGRLWGRFSVVVLLVSYAAVLSVVTHQRGSKNAMKAAVCGKERCLTTLRTAAKETIVLFGRLVVGLGRYC